MGYDKDGDIDVDDLRLLTDQDVIDRVLKPHYWDRWQADKIKSQSIANLLVDWVWASGKPGITRVQQILGVKQDGIVGDKTLDSLNSYPDQKYLFARIHAARVTYIENLCIKNPSQKVFREGWLRRLNAIGYGTLLHNGAKTARTFPA